MGKTKKYFIKTFGCQANIADSEKIDSILEPLGFEKFHVFQEFTNELNELRDVLPNVDLFIINTCSVRQKSEDKVYGLGKIFAEAKRRGQRVPYVLMCGCMVGSVTGERVRYPFNELKKRTPWVNYYISPSQIHSLPIVLSNVFGPPVQSKSQKEKFTPRHAYINISSGCDNFCSYCVVPYARGSEVSHSETGIIQEVEKLISRGIKELTLCGQNVNSWGLSPVDKFKVRAGSDFKLPFADLLRKLHSFKQLEKIEFISSNPFDFSTDLIEAFSLPKISNYLHIAVQSGNNEVLKKMNRRHTREEFIELLKSIEKTKPKVEFGTDIIVGFPGETENQFMDTVSLFKRVYFSVAFINMYSPRKGTLADRLYSDDVSIKEKKRRHDFLTKVWKEQKQKKLKR